MGVLANSPNRLGARLPITFGRVAARYPVRNFNILARLGTIGWRGDPSFTMAYFFEYVNTFTELTVCPKLNVVFHRTSSNPLLGFIVLDQPSVVFSNKSRNSRAVFVVIV